MSFLAKIGRGFAKFGNFLSDGWLELKKVRWPNRKEMVSYTLIVLAVVVIITIYFAITDTFLSRTLEWLFGS